MWQLFVLLSLSNNSVSTAWQVTADRITNCIIKRNNAVWFWYLTKRRICFLKKQVKVHFSRPMKQLHTHVVSSVHGRTDDRTAPGLCEFIILCQNAWSLEMSREKLRIERLFHLLNQIPFLINKLESWKIRYNFVKRQVSQWTMLAEL